LVSVVGDDGRDDALDVSKAEDCLGGVGSHLGKSIGVHAAPKGENVVERKFLFDETNPARNLAVLAPPENAQTEEER
jgi:hypothetical protein